MKNAPTHTIIESVAFTRRCVSLGLSAEVFAEIYDTYAADPAYGAVVRGTGGLRKGRIAKDATGKSGGYRVFSFYANARNPGVPVVDYRQGGRRQHLPGAGEGFQCGDGGNQEGTAEMKGEDFAGIMEGLNDTLAYVRGDESRGRIVRGMDVRDIRTATHKTQVAFATAFHIPLGTLKDWEQNRRQPDAPARTLLTLIRADPVRIEKLLAKAD